MIAIVAVGVALAGVILGSARGLGGRRGSWGFSARPGTKNGRL